MQTNNGKTDIESLQSLSIDRNLCESKDSNLLERAVRKSSFDLVNFLKDSDQYACKEIKASLQFLNSRLSGLDNINRLNNYNLGMRSPSQFYNEEDKIKIQEAGIVPLQIGEVEQSDEENQSKQSNYMSSDMVKLQYQHEPVYYPPDMAQRIHQFLPAQIADIIKQYDIPMQYISGLIHMNVQKPIKSTRRLKVQRYLEKRKRKTWNRKICYNCRQKVAEERLRIKGKFIKKKRAIEILGLKGPISTVQLKKRLQQQLNEMSPAQIQRIIKQDQ